MILKDINVNTGDVVLSGELETKLGNYVKTSTLSNWNELSVYFDKNSGLKDWIKSVVA